ncbi:hypothetical protein EDB86DRAFT_2961453 [Lactarius hatsudake]|nr:hypothetical protein EDB86DRAFT_2961453 [Lactarius hatsudake]
MHSVLNTFVRARVSGKEKKRRIQEHLSAERMQNKSPAQPLLFQCAPSDDEALTRVCVIGFDSGSTVYYQPVTAKSKTGGPLSKNGRQLTSKFDMRGS